MLLEFGAENFYSFREGFSISLRLGSNCPEQISKNKTFATALCIKGANAAGKSNVIKAIEFLSLFCSHSFDNKPESEIAIEPFYNNTKPIHLYAIFSINDIEYEYEVALTRKKIIEETLYRTIKRKTQVIKRIDNKFTSLNSDFDDLSKINLRSNASFISTAHQYETASIVSIYNFFDLICNNTNANAGTSLKQVSKTTEFYLEQENILNYVVEKLKACDVGISGIEIREIENENGEILHIPFFEHTVDGNKEIISYRAESSGTMSLYMQLGFYKIILDFGGLLILDEFDYKLHPDILQMIIEFFISDNNRIDAQFIFSTHNTQILDLMSKYRTVLVNKDENESFLYRLDEIPGDIIRNDRSLIKAYQSGRIGGKPRI